MEIFLERLLLELAAIAVQLAVMGIIRWLRDRSLSPDTPAELSVAA